MVSGPPVSSIDGSVGGTLTPSPTRLGVVTVLAGDHLRLAPRTKHRGCSVWSVDQSKSATFPAYRMNPINALAKSMFSQTPIRVTRRKGLQGSQSEWTLRKCPMIIKMQPIRKDFIGMTNNYQNVANHKGLYRYDQ